ncbi:hypothetical protein [uncultured Enterovirga sp.]|uniref:hypothetical protein n=1 Tax=uncultured Enterovirga sp. TaxID=2026352 RepID=UPI0035CAA23C
MKVVLGALLALFVVGAQPVGAMSIDAQVRLLGGFQPRAADLGDPAVQAITASTAWRKASETGSLNGVLREQAVLPKLIGDRRRAWADESPSRTLFSPKSRAQMSEFFARNLGPASTETRNLLYLFGGPDVLYPNLLFPNVEHLVLVGLERPGQVFSPQDLVQSKTLDATMGRVARAYNALMRLSYYITTAMAKELTEFGTSTMIAVGLAANDFEILAVEPVAIDSAGQLRVSTDRSNGVRVRFRKPNGREGDVTYFRMDLSDQNLQRNPDFMKFLEGSRFDTAYYKAASFVSSSREFDGLNKFVIGQVKHVVQNDDGIPLRAFKDTASSWSLRLFGHYTRPHKQFGTSGPQNDLKSTTGAALCRTASKDDKDLWRKLWSDGCRAKPAYDFAALDWIGPIPFRYGYGAVGGPRTDDPDRFSTLMVFDRK